MFWGKGTRRHAQARAGKRSEAHACKPPSVGTAGTRPSRSRAGPAPPHSSVTLILVPSVHVPDGSRLRLLRQLRRFAFSFRSTNQLRPGHPLARRLPPTSFHTVFIRASLPCRPSILSIPACRCSCFKKGVTRSSACCPSPSQRSRYDTLVVAPTTPTAPYALSTPRNHLPLRLGACTVCVVRVRQRDGASKAATRASVPTTPTNQARYGSDDPAVSKGHRHRLRHPSTAHRSLLLGTQQHQFLQEWRRDQVPCDSSAVSDSWCWYCDPSPIPYHQLVGSPFSYGSIHHPTCQRG